MPEPLVTAAPWIALVAGLLAMLVTGWGARGAWHAWRRARVTQEAASALLDVHAQRLDETLRLLDERVGAVADDGDQLAEALEELRADTAHLRWMLGTIPDERSRLMQELSHLLLPTDDEEREPAGTGARDA